MISEFAGALASRWVCGCPQPLLQTVVIAMLVGTTLVAQCGQAQDAGPAVNSEAANARIRVATFNTSLYREASGELAIDLKTGENAQAKQIAAILQTVRPDIVLLNEIDFETDHRAVKLLLKKYLHVSQRVSEEQLEPLAYDFFFAGPVNTGVPSGLDLSGDGVVAGPNDAWGYGKYEGQYGMVVLSRFPIQTDKVRTFQKFLWKDLPGAKRPIVPASGKSFYSDEVWQALRLSSKSHWDVPIEVDGQVLHLLASHPTPPAFDGPEDRNGCRNHDEIRFWTEYINGEQTGQWLIDDSGNAGGIDAKASFVIVGDLNADPKDGSGIQTGIIELLNHPRTNDPMPKSEGAVAASQQLGKANAQHRGNPALDTSQFSPNSVGNLRVDYCVPSSDLKVLDSGVFWPAPGTPAAELIEATDHRLVWCDLQL